MIVRISDMAKAMTESLTRRPDNHQLPSITVSYGTSYYFVLE